jgi:hypothetical protein
VLSLAKKVLVTYKPLDMQMWANQNAFDVANVTSLLDVWIFLGFVSCPCLSCSMGLSTQFKLKTFMSWILLKL